MVGNLYEQLERNRVRKTEGKTKFDEWTAGRKVERTERVEWRRSRDLKTVMREMELAEAAAQSGALRSAMYWPGGGPGAGVMSAFTEPKRRKLSEIDTDLLPPEEVPEEEEEEE